MTLRKRSLSSRLHAFFPRRGAGLQITPAISRTKRDSLPRVEQLEERQVLSGYTPTAVEQLFLERLNDARANPAAYGASIGVDLSGVAPSQPLAFDTRLVQSSRDHSLDMSNNNYFGHTGSDGSSPFQRMTAAGFPWTGAAESIAAGYSTPEAALQGLITDAGVSDLGHRKQLLSWGGSPYTGLRETGVGIVLGGSGSYHNYYTIDSGFTSDSRPYLTGVAFNDANSNGKYDTGEELGGVTVTVAGAGSTTTWSSGGYSFRLSPGTYTVTASGGGLSAPITKTVTVGATNYRLNFINGTGGGGGGGGSGTPIVDDGDASGFTTKGSWLRWTGPGYYNNNARYLPAGTGANTATWAFTGLADGWYTVQADWAAYSGHASNATYTITAGGTTSTAVADQRPASSGPVFGGVGFQTLATVYVTGGTVTVTESDKADGILVADAVRLASAPAPTTDLTWSGGGLSGLPPAVAPATPFTVTRTYTITGGAVPEPFSIGYYASPDGTFARATLLASEAVPTGAAAGTYTGSSPALQFSSPGTYYLLARLDDGGVVQETDETNDVSPAAGPINVSGLSSAIIDNGQAGYSDAGGGWLSWSGPGYYNGNARYAPAGTGASTATWAFAGLADGWYTVQADWAAYSGHASNATYRIATGGNTSTAVADQRPASSGPVIGGVGFQTLATVYVTGGTVTVSLSDKADGILVADAVRLASAPAPTTDLTWSGGGLSGLPPTVAPATPFTVTRTYTITGGAVPEPFGIGYYASTDGTFARATLLASEAVPTGAAAGTYTGSSPALQFSAAGTYYLLARLDDTNVVGQTDETNDVSPAAGPINVSGLFSAIIDNGQAGYSDAGGGWLSWSGPGYYNGNARYAYAGTGASVATWAFTGLAAGTYQVQADWAAYSGHASNATYRITAGGTTTTAVADQRPASGGTTVGGVGFQTLATVTVGSDGTLTVSLSDKADGIVAADAIRIVKVG